MNLLLILLPLSLLLGFGFLAAFIWAAQEGQMDDLDTPAHRILFDDERQQHIQSGKEET